MDAASETTKRERGSADGPSRDLLTRLRRFAATTWQARRATLARLGIGVGVSGLMVAIVIAITGGFVIDAGPFYLSAHRLLPPFVIAAAAYLLAASQGRTSVVAADAALAEFVQRHALAITIVLAAAAAGVGVAFGTYVAAASDPSAYLSQARLIAQGHLTVPVPLASQVSWATPELTFAPLGYRPGPEAGQLVPTYPPGLPFLMAAALVIAGENGPYFVPPLLGAFVVLSSYALGARLHSRTAGVIAASLMATSPLLLSQIVQLMSDIPATAFWMLALLAALAGRPITSGILSAVAIPIRPSLIPVAGVMALVLAIWSDSNATSRRPTIVSLAQFVVACAPGVAALAWTQWRLYGDPRASGHGTFAELFAVANIVPNIRDYTMRVLTGEAPALALVAASIVALVVGRSVATRITPEMRPTTAAPSAVSAACIAVLVAMPVLACYLAYGVFPDWSYLRFLLPIWPVAFAAAGAVIANAGLQLPAACRTQVLVFALTAVCARNVVTASHEGSFTLWADALRYGTTGRYLEAALPKNAVIVTSQHSGSASYYTGRPIVRWDLLDVGFDQALDDLARLGRAPVIVVEDWEQARLRQQFPASTFARLDWPPRADFGKVTRVRLFDPADRERPTGRPPDRLP